MQVIRNRVYTETRERPAVPETPFITCFAPQNGTSCLPQRSTTGILGWKAPRAREHPRVTHTAQPRRLTATNKVAVRSDLVR